MSGTLEKVTVGDITVDPSAFVPTAEPWRSRWCVLDSLHRLALSAFELDETNLQKWRKAYELAEAKYAVYCDSIGDPLPRRDGGL